MFCYTVKIWVCEPKPLKGLIGRKIRAATWTLRPSPASTTATQLLLTCGPISIPHSNQHTDWLLSSLFCCHIENISYLKDKMSPQYDLGKTLKETSRAAGVAQSHSLMIYGHCIFQCCETNRLSPNKGSQSCLPPTTSSGRERKTFSSCLTGLMEIQLRYLKKSEAFTTQNALP